jgi:predicted transcriptional regulator
MEQLNVQRRDGLYGFEYLEYDGRRREEGTEPTHYEIKQLWQRSHEIVNLAARGFKNTDIAKILNISPVTVSNTLNGKLGQLKLSEIRRSRDEEAKVVSEKIRVLTDKALDVYHEIFDDDSGNTNLKDKKAAADTVVLELSGLRAPTRIQSSSIGVHLSREDLEEFKKRGIAAAREAGMIIDIVPEDA